MSQLEEVTFSSEVSGLSRTIWFSAGPAAAAHRLCVFLDGEHYLNDIDAVATVEALVEKQGLAPMSLVFVSNGGSAARHEDYTCSEAYAAYIGEELVQWAQSRLPSIGWPSIGGGAQNVLCGVSLSGLAAAHVSLRYPDVFPLVLAQSGSFWWNDMRFAQLVGERVGERAAALDRFWISVGDLETDVDVSHPPTGLHQVFSQIVGVEAAVAALEEAGADVHLNRFHGGHTFAPWREELGEALRWLVD